MGLPASRILRPCNGRCQLPQNPTRSTGPRFCQTNCRHALPPLPQSHFCQTNPPTSSLFRARERGREGRLTSADTDTVGSLRLKCPPMLEVRNEGCSAVAFHKSATRIKLFRDYSGELCDRQARRLPLARGLRLPPLSYHGMAARSGITQAGRQPTYRDWAGGGSGSDPRRTQ